MKNFLLILLFTSCSIIAKTKNLDGNLVSEIDKDEVRSKCEIVSSNVYNYCINHGFSENQAKVIAKASLKECNRISSAE